MKKISLDSVHWNEYIFNVAKIRRHLHELGFTNLKVCMKVNIFSLYSIFLLNK